MEIDLVSIENAALTQYCVSSKTADQKIFEIWK